MYAVVSLALGESAKKPTIEGFGDFLQSDPAPPLKDSFNPNAGLKETPETLPTYQPGMLYPEGGFASEQAGVPLRDGVAKQRVIAAPAYPLPEHDPLYAYVHDVGWTLPTPAPPPSAPVQSAGGALTEGELLAVLTEAGWPAELHDEALRIIHCESRGRPDALGDGGKSAGLFQLNIATWFRYAGENPDLWADPLVNARTAWATYNYDLGRGYVPWKQWSCRKVLH